MSKHYSLRSFGSYMARYKGRFAVVLLCFVVGNVCLTIIPVFIGKLVGALTAAPVNRDLAYVYVGILIACSVGHNLTWHASEFLYMKLLKPIGFWYENIVFARIIRRPYPYFVDKFTGKIAAYIDTISQELRELIDNICYDYTIAVVRLVSMTAILTAVNWQTGVLFVGTVLLMLLVGRYTIRNSIRYEKRFTDVQSTKTGIIVDAMANFVNVKSFQKEHREIASVEKEQSRTIAASLKAFFWNMVFWGSMGYLVRVLLWPAAILLNVHLYLNGQLSVAELTTFLSAILLFSDFVWDVIWNISQFNIKLARIEEAHTYLFGKTNIVVRQQDSTAPAAAEAPVFLESFRLEGINFAYPDNRSMEVLSGIELDIKKGEKVGIVGKSGSGKTTLTKLLLDYYGLQHGRLLLDGRTVTSAQIAAMVAYVPQDTTLFHRSIADNIAYAADRTVSRTEIVEAAKKAHADEFISQIGSGYDAIVGERGVKLSAGQRQRIAIARAFLDDKPLLILDEATSALDSESELLVQKALEALWHDKTVIAIAHRLSTLRHMDRIVVMDRGRITEQGTHAELLAAKGTYAELWAHQSGGFLEEQ